MNILEEIQNCPVEWRELGEISHFYGGLTGKTKSDFENGNAKYVTYKNIFNNLQVELNLLETVRVDENEKQNSINYGDVLITGSSESKEEVGMSSVVTFIPDEPIYLNSFSFGIRFNEDVELLPEFTKYLFRSFRLRKQIEKTASGVTRYNVSKVTFKKIKVPLLPLEIQEKIVQILDKMTEYVTELTSELTSRKKQYSFYRDKLLSFEDEVYQVEWKTLGDIGKVSMCKRILKNQTSDDGEIPFYKIGTFGKVATSFISRELFEEYKLRFSYPKLGDILISASGTIGRTVVFNGEDSYFQDSNIVWLEHDESQVLNRYLYYFYQMNPWKVSDGGTISRLYNGNIEKTTIPVPSLEIQSRIVQVLDNFDMVCNDLNIGLPKEIELRQKQYEYFREKLLTFVAEGEYTESRVEEWDNSAIIKLLQWVFGPIRVEVGQVVNLQRGKRLVRNQLTTSGSFPVYQNSLTPLGYFTHSNRGKETNFVICAGAAGEIGYSDRDFWAADDVYTLETLDNIADKFMYYVLLSKQDRLKSQVRKASIPRLSKDAIDKVTFYLPSLTEQKRIVSVLDNFNTLTNSLSEGLPKEIELRQKQYEYWRNQLLNFNE